MKIDEKKSFLEAIYRQISRYTSHIDNNLKYVGVAGNCPICQLYYDHDNYSGKQTTNGCCGKCPMFFFIHNNFNDSSAWPCSYRMTYPENLMDVIKTHTNGEEPWNKDYTGEAEYYAREFWMTLERLVKKTAAKNIILTDNSKFVIKMFMIDKKIREEAEKEIAYIYKTK